MSATKKLVAECYEDQNTPDTLMILLTILTHTPKPVLKTEVMPLSHPSRQGTLCCNQGSCIPCLLIKP